MNRNVPKGVEVLGRVSYMSGEIIYTYYLQRYSPPHPEYGHWAFWKVCDWVGSKPEPTNATEMDKVLGDDWRRSQTANA